MSKTFLTGIHEIDRVFGGLPVNTVWTHLDTDLSRGFDVVGKMASSILEQGLRVVHMNHIPENPPAVDVMIITLDNPLGTDVGDLLSKAQYSSIYNNMGTLLFVQAPTKFRGTEHLVDLHQGSIAERCDLVTATLTRPHSDRVWMRCLKVKARSQRPFDPFLWEEQTTSQEVHYGNMTPVRMLDIVKRMRDQVSEGGEYQPLDSEKYEQIREGIGGPMTNPNTQLAYALTMMDKLTEMLQQPRVNMGKANRWLGCIQGMLSSWLGVDEMRAFNRNEDK